MKKLSSLFVKNAKQNKGFTLIEILVVIGIIAVLAAIVIVAINPAKQFAQSRNTQRTSNVETILNAIGQRIADNKGVFAGTFTINAVNYTCPALTATTLYTIATNPPHTTGSVIDLSCLTPTYISSGLPFDPNGGSWTSNLNYDTSYTAVVDATGRYTICAPNAANETSVPNAATICLTR